MLIAASEQRNTAIAPICSGVENSRYGEVMKMREVKSFEVPAGGSFELKPGGAHLMLVDLRRPLKKGEKVPLTLKLAKSGELQLELSVEEMGARQPGH